MKLYRFLFALPFILFVSSAEAQTISLGPVFGAFAPYIDAAVNGAIALAFGWGAWWLKTKWNIDVDAGHRDALKSYVQRQAASLVADGLVKVNGLQVNVGSGAVAAVGNAALSHIPDAMSHFGLTPEKVAQMIVDAIPNVSSVAAVAAAQAKPV